MSLDTPKIIALYSPAPQSGKTTVARFLEENFNFQPLSIANPIKLLVRQLLLSCGIDPVTVTQLMDHAKETPIPRLGNKSVRELCQTLGKDWGRDMITTDLWVYAALKKVRPGRHYVIDDLRFPEEYHTIKERGGVVWKIIRDAATLPNTHQSEGLLEGEVFDRVLVNNGSKEQLYRQIILAKEHTHENTNTAAA